MNSDTPITITTISDNQQDVVQLLVNLQSTINNQTELINKLQTDLAEYKNETTKLSNAQFVKLRNQLLNDKFCADEPFVGPDCIKKRKSSSAKLAKSSSWEIRKKADLKAIAETI